MIDGHDLGAIDTAMADAEIGDGRPTVVLARTVKGRGVPDIENAGGWHGRPLPREAADRAIERLGGRGRLVVAGPLPPDRSDRERPARPASQAAKEVPVAWPTYPIGHEVATRVACGDALVALAARPEVVVLDADVGNSTYADLFQRVAPNRFFEMHIAEQQLVAAAIGLSARGHVAFASTFGAFLSRAYDFVRMDGISQVGLRLIGSHAGVEIGSDGPSQMALEDIASIRAVQGSVVLYPCDAPSTVRLVDVMASTPGITYLRTTRGAYPVIYPDDEVFAVGGSKVHRRRPEDRPDAGDDQVALIGAGVTVHECLEAADVLARLGIAVRVIDLYSVKPLDADTLVEACRVTSGRLVVVEDHHPEGGIGSAVLEALAAHRVGELHLAHLAVRDVPGSGTPQQLLNAAGLSAPHIVDAARMLLTSPAPDARARPGAGLGPAATG